MSPTPNVQQYIDISITQSPYMQMIELLVPGASNYDNFTSQLPVGEGSIEYPTTIR